MPNRQRAAKPWPLLGPILGALVIVGLMLASVTSTGARGRADDAKDTVEALQSAQAMPTRTAQAIASQTAQAIASQTAQAQGTGPAPGVTETLTATATAEAIATATAQAEGTAQAEAAASVTAQAAATATAQAAASATAQADAATAAADQAATAQVPTVMPTPPPSPTPADLVLPGRWFPQPWQDAVGGPTALSLIVFGVLAVLILLVASLLTWALVRRRREPAPPVQPATPGPKPPEPPGPVPVPVVPSPAPGRPALQSPTGLLLRLEKDSARLGRAADNDLVIPGDLAGSQTVSEHHARLEWDAARRRCIVVDEGSRNGVYVQGLRTGEAVLHDGDAVRFGSVEFIFRQQA
jgi:hypothetical protein